jgi:hypothetical protein
MYVKINHSDILSAALLAVKVGWKQGKALGSEEGSVMGSGMLGVCRGWGGGKDLSVGA